MFYDINGTPLTGGFLDNIDVDYEFDSASNANYTIIRIYKNKIDGEKQFPFVYAPNGSGAGTQSTYDMAHRDGFPFAINAGTFNVTTIKPNGIVIQNSNVIQNEVDSTGHGRMPLTIDSNGDLSYAAADADANTLANDGIVSAVVGFCPIIINYENAENIITLPDETTWTANAQRQIIGQFGNGDYAVITCEGRSFDNSDGWTLAEAQSVCKKVGLKFAYNLDGGGSTETMLGLKHFNTIYDNTTGRIVPTFIVFNGTTRFFVPNS